MSDKTKKLALLWNVLEQRIEGVHGTKEDAERAATDSLAHAGENADGTLLHVAEFEVPAPPTLEAADAPAGEPEGSGPESPKEA